MHDHKDEAGFSYVDVMVAVTILLIGIMALIGAITSAVMMTTQGEQQLAAKQYALSTLEAVFSARDIQATGFGWDSTRNTADGGIFPNGRQPIWPTFGKDGIVGTTDDVYGPDGSPGTGDEGEPLGGYERQVSITDIPNPERPRDPISLRQIDVTIFYNVGSIQRQETVTTYIADYRTKPEE
jgi:type II secretory pathway pseudopilin PulG